MEPEQISGDELVPVAADFGSVPTQTRPPRVWTVFVAFVIAIVGSLAVQILGVIVLMAWYAAHGADVQKLAKDLPAMLTEPVPFMIFVGLAQLTILLSAIGPARLSTQPATYRLGLVKPTLPGWSYPFVAVGTLLPFAVGLVPAYFLAKQMGPNTALTKLYQQMNWTVAIPFILFIAIAPAITEELLFRGYIQRRLLQRWSPWLAIGVTSVLFSLIHLEPRQMVYVFPIGIWLGVIAWRTGSVWPGMICHAFLNGSWNIFQIGGLLNGMSENTATIVALTAAGVGLACFGVSIWVLFWKCTAPVRGPLPSEGSMTALPVDVNSIEGAEPPEQDFGANSP